jgi:hypothetical protein
MEKTYTITHNEQFDSLEVSFTTMPAAEVRAALKTMGFRWHSVKKLWYGHAEESAVLAAIDPQPEPDPEPSPKSEKTADPTQVGGGISPTDAARIYGILKAAEDALRDDSTTYAAAKLQEAMSSLLDISTKETAKKTGRTQTLAAVKRILKGGQKSTQETLHYSDNWNGLQLVCDGYRVIGLNTPLANLPERPAHVTPMQWEKLMTKPSETQHLTLPDPAELKAWITRQKEAWKASHNGSTRAMPDLHYDFGTDKPAVNAAFLLDMLEALPGCQAEYTGTLTAIHFTAETGIGLLMPVRPAKERKETDLAA